MESGTGDSGTAVNAPAAELDAVVERAMREHDLPGLAMGLIQQGNEQVAGYGITDVEHPLTVTGDTIF